MDGTRQGFLEIPGTLALHDLTLDGRALVHHGFERVGLRARAALKGHRYEGPEVRRTSEIRWLKTSPSQWTKRTA